MALLVRDIIYDRLFEIKSSPAFPVFSSSVVDCLQHTELCNI